MNKYIDATDLRDKRLTREVLRNLANENLSSALQADNELAICKREETERTRRMQSEIEQLKVTAEKAVSRLDIEDHSVEEVLTENEQLRQQVEDLTLTIDMQEGIIEAQEAITSLLTGAVRSRHVCRKCS